MSSLPLMRGEQDAYEAERAAWLEAHPTAMAIRRRPTTRVNYTERAKERIAAGVHPVLYPLRLRQPVGEQTCGSCGNLSAVTPHDKRFLKCLLRDSNSEATDLRRWWPACTSWKPQ